jgi:hypothetical protein
MRFRSGAEGRRDCGEVQGVAAEERRPDTAEAGRDEDRTDQRPISAAMPQPPIGNLASGLAFAIVRCDSASLLPRSICSGCA